MTLTVCVATATYGSGFAYQVRALRQFRNKYLLSHSIGKKFVQAYYELGPKAARYIHDKPILKYLARAFITPFWVFAWLSMKIGLLAAFGCVAFFFVLCILVYRQYRKRGRTLAT